MTPPPCATCQRPSGSLVHLLGHGYRSPTLGQNKRQAKKGKSPCKKCGRRPDAWVHMFGHSYKASM